MSFASFIKVTANHPERSLHISAFTFQPAHLSRPACDAGAPQMKWVTTALAVTILDDNVENEAASDLSKNLTNMVNSGTERSIVAASLGMMLQARRSRILTAERLIDCEIVSINRRHAGILTLRFSAISSTSSSTRHGMPLSGCT